MPHDVTRELKVGDVVIIHGIWGEKPKKHIVTEIHQPEPDHEWVWKREWYAVLDPMWRPFTVDDFDYNEESGRWDCYLWGVQTKGVTIGTPADLNRLVKDVVEVVESEVVESDDEV